MDKKDLVKRVLILLFSAFIIPFLSNIIFVKIIGSIDNIMDINFLILIGIGFVWLLVMCLEGLLSSSIHRKLIKSQKRFFNKKIYLTVGTFTYIFFIIGLISGLICGL